MGAVPIVCAEEEVDAGNAHNGASSYPPAAAVESYDSYQVAKIVAGDIASASAIGIREEQDDKLHS